MAAPLPALPTFRGTDTKDATLMIAGSHVPLVLYSEYDVEQEWLPFIDSVIFKPLLEAQPVEPVADWRKMLGEKARKKFARLPQACQRIVEYQSDNHQRPLPFREIKKVSNKEFNRLREARFPAWDRNMMGEIIEVQVPEAKKEAAMNWALHKMKGRFYAHRRDTIFVFERASDAALFKMQFGIEWQHA